MPEKTRTLFYVVSSLEGGGAEYQIPAIVTAIEATGVKVRVLACRLGDGLAAARLEQAGISWELLSKDGSSRTASLLRLFILARRHAPDLIWTSLPRATLDGQIVGRALGIPIISWQHSAYTRPYKRMIMPLLQRLSNLWVADSANVSRYLAEDMRVRPDRIASWPLFVAPTQAPQAKPWDGGDFIVGSVGRLHHHKNYPALLQAAAALRQTDPRCFARLRLRIAGTGPDRDALMALAAELRLSDRLELVGHLDDTSAFLAGLHLYVQPSRMEGMCIAAHEAMAAGLAVVASPVGELERSVIDGRTGTLLADDAPATLSAALSAFIREPDLAHAYGTAAAELVRKRYAAAAFLAAPIRIILQLRSRPVERRRSIDCTAASKLSGFSAPRRAVPGKAPSY